MNTGDDFRKAGITFPYLTSDVKAVFRYGKPPDTFSFHPNEEKRLFFIRMNIQSDEKNSDFYEEVFDNIEFDNLIRPKGTPTVEFFGSKTASVTFNDENLIPEKNDVCVALSVPYDTERPADEKLKAEETVKAFEWFVKILDSELRKRDRHTGVESHTIETDGVSARIRDEIQSRNGKQSFRPQDTGRPGTPHP